MKRLQFLSLFPIVGFATKLLAAPKELLNIQSIGATQEAKINKVKLTIYLLLDGNCKPAMEFYRSVFGGELTLTKVGDSAMKNMMPPAMHDRLINAG